MLNNTGLTKFSYGESQGTAQFNSHFSVIINYASKICTTNTLIGPTIPNLAPHGNTSQVVTITLISNHYYTALLHKHDTLISSPTTITVPRLIAMALGLLFRRLNHAPASFNFSWPKGVSAENKNKMSFMYGSTQRISFRNMVLSVRKIWHHYYRRWKAECSTTICTYGIHNNVLGYTVHLDWDCTKLVEQQTPFSIAQWRGSNVSVQPTNFKSSKYLRSFLQNLPWFHFVSHG